MEAAAKDTLEISQQAHLPAEGGDNVKYTVPMRSNQYDDHVDSSVAIAAGIPIIWDRLVGIGTQSVHRAKRKAT